MTRRIAQAIRGLLPVVVAFFALLLLCDGAAACPTCKVALASHEGKGDIVGGYFWSILFMMSMPFMIFGSLGGLFYYEVRKARAKQNEATTGRESLGDGMK